MAGGRPRGLGKTPGSGRKAGVPNKATVSRARALVEASSAMNIKLTDAVLARLDPVDTMLHLMRAALRAGEVNLALDCARSAAPYISPKLQSSTVMNMTRRSINDFSDADLTAVAAGDFSDLADDELQVLIDQRQNRHAIEEAIDAVDVQKQEADARAVRDAARDRGESL